MLLRTFVHLPGIGPSTEKKFWDQGIQSWASLRERAPTYFRGAKLDSVVKLLDDTEAAWERRDPVFFYDHLPHFERWRLLPDFLDGVAFLDIETNGLKLPPLSQSTTITFYYRGNVYQEFEHEKKAALVRWMCEEATVFCTFFGEVFDLPFLRREFNLPIKKAHLDLCFWLKRFKIGGGLKKVEKSFDDIPRRQALDIGGLDAVRLWDFHEKGVPGALETLLHYNAEDTVVLEPLLVKAFNLELEARPHLGIPRLEAKEFPKLSTKIDPAIYQRLRSH